MDHPLMQTQVELEARMASLGVEKFRHLAVESRQGGEATRSRSMQTVLTVLIEPTAVAIKAFRAVAESGKAGRKHSAVRALHGLEPEALAWLAGRLILDGFAQRQNLTRLSVKIGATVELEQRLARFASANGAYLSTVLEDQKTRSSDLEFKRRALVALLHLKSDDWDPWGDRERLLAGSKLVEMIVQSTGLFTIENTTRGKRQLTELLPTQRFRDWLASLDSQFEVMSPEFLPCVVPPKDWTKLTGGGYHTDAFASPLRLVKTRSKQHRKALERADLGAVMAAVNSVQRTAWAIEGRTLAVMSALMDRGHPIAGLPQMEEDPLPTRPADIDTNEGARKAWRSAAREVHDRNRTLISRRLLALKVRAIATQFAQYPAIYFPHQLDFRGRVYAVPQILNPQGSDLAKGLLVFAEGGSIRTPEALDWFFIHGANSFGVDRVSFEERRQWVMTHQADILRSAMEPLDHLWWTEADSPFVFLTWCFEFAEWVRNPHFESRIPIAMDGSCNGLQHYSAMLRDPIGGKAVNLVPGDRPQDIYAEVAKVVEVRLEAITEDFAVNGGSDEDRLEATFAAQWFSFGIDRKMTKRPVMVLPYGSTLSKCQRYILEAAQAKISAGKPNPFGDDLFPACNWLGTRVWEAIGEVVVAARLGMGWLRHVAQQLTKGGHSLTWTMPSGFVVVQDYASTKDTRINTHLLGVRFQPRLKEELPDTLDRARQVNGVAPNFVHSLDASALTLTVNRAAERGLTQFAMIHDSYGTTAAHAPALAAILRDAFVTMYSGPPVLEAFGHEVVPPALKPKVKEPPVVGGLDLSGTKDSLYFFA